MVDSPTASAVVAPFIPVPPPRGWRPHFIGAGAVGGGVAAVFGMPRGYHLTT